MDAAAVIIPLVVVVVIIALVVLSFWITRSNLIALQQRVDEAWTDIEAITKQRADLIPRMVGLMRGPAAHETAVFDSLETARTETLTADTPAEATTAETHLQQALRSLVTTADGYPKLAASPDFLKLRADLGETEDRMQTSRRFYNGGVRELNTKLQVLPGRFVGKRVGIAQREFFEVGASTIAEPPRIQF